MGKSVIRYWAQGLVYIVEPDDDVVDYVLANPGLDLQAYLDQLITAGDPCIKLAPLLQPPLGGDG